MLRNKTFLKQLKIDLETTDTPRGFALPTALALGLVMIALAGTSTLAGQGIRNDAVQYHDIRECARGANVKGMVWVESFISSRTNAKTRMDPDSDEGDGDIDSTRRVTAGIIVPDDVSNLSDVLSKVGITPRYRFEQIKHWQRVN